MLLRCLTVTACLVVLQAPAFQGTLRMRTISVALDGDALQERLLDAAPASVAAREDAQVETTALRVRNGILRLEHKDSSERGFALMDLGRRVFVMINDAERAYVEFPLPVVAPAGRRPAGPAAKPLGARVVNGIKTTGYEVRGPDLVVRAWMTQEYPGLTWTFRAAAAQDDSDDDDPEVAAHAALAPYGFPVLLITLTPGSLEIEETVAIEQATLGAELFQIPAGYAKRTMPGGPQ